MTMGPRRHPWAWSVAAWTAAALGTALGVALWALLSLDAAQQRCFMNYPAVPCPGPDDPAITALWISFFALPAVWLAGIVGLALARPRRRRSAGA